VLRITWPPCLLELGEDDARRLVADEVARQLAEAHAQIRAKRWSVLGPIAAANASPFRRAKTWETFGSLHPSFATGPGCVVERIETATELRELRQAYRACWERYHAGETDVVYPYGTYLMRVRHGVRVAEPWSGRSAGARAWEPKVPGPRCVRGSRQRRIRWPELASGGGSARRIGNPPRWRAGDPAQGSSRLPGCPRSGNAT